jgi:LAO/AO transport system kinase
LRVLEEIRRLASRILKNDRRAISKGITLVESSRADHREEAVSLIDLLSKSGNKSLRIGLSGTPGVGKSTFIEKFGLMLIEKGLSVAVLAIDPSSVKSGGSILGDKTRMEKLSRQPQAFIRPSPTLTYLGGVSQRTRESITICEAAGFDVVIIETVGVGQSETMVSEMSDLFLLLLAPAGGDDLQGVKRGIMEIADIIVVNKADGELKPAAMRTQSDYAGALELFRDRAEDPVGFPKVLLVSSVSGEGIDKVWLDIQLVINWRKESGNWLKRREEQAVHWFESEVQNRIINEMNNKPDVKKQMKILSKKVALNELSPDSAAKKIIELYNK